MNDGKIYITLSDKRAEGTSNGGKLEKKDYIRRRKTLPEELKVDFSNGINEGVAYLQHEFIHIAKQQASQYINYSIENIGNFTGNYQTQRDVQAALNATGILVSAATAGFYVGVTTSSPVLGLFAAAVSVGVSAINYNRQEKANQFAIKRQNHEVEIIRDISGLNSLTNGSRIGD